VSAPHATSSFITEDDADMKHEVEMLHASIVQRLRRAGVRIPDAAIGEIAEDVLADAVRLSLIWLRRD
jgi:hypothetical protein